ncbi:50S ribosomal protein L21 [candidate division KSB1 bacterium]|nr:50S ribosomal protein L21 [candidate division KSB1 bacterium]
MYAVVDIAGQQFKVQSNAVIVAPKMNGQPGETLEFDNVLLVANDAEVKIGTPMVAGSRVKASIVAHTRGKKVVVFKKKRRKTYRVKRGHVQEYTKLKIDEIL